MATLTPSLCIKRYSGSGLATFGEMPSCPHPTHTTDPRTRFGSLYRLRQPGRIMAAMAGRTDGTVEFDKRVLFSTKINRVPD